MVDVFAPIALLVTSGTTTGGQAAVINLPVPAISSLSGLQLTFQSLVGPVNGVPNSLGFPSLAVITQ